MDHPEPWPLPDRKDLRDALVTAYSTGRGYHDLRHLTEVLARIRELGEAENTEVVLAAWYHDAVYDASGDNEELSAQLAETELATAPVDAADASSRRSRSPPIAFSLVCRVASRPDCERRDSGSLKNAAQGG